MNRRLATLFASLLIATLPAICQTPQPKFPKPGTRVGLADWKPTQQEVMASYWSLEPGWNTELEIRNNLVERQLTVTPVLRTAAGREIALPDVVLASEEVTSINLQQALSQAAPELVNRMGSFGSAAVRFGGLNDRNVFAAAMVYREGHPIDFHFDGYDAASNDGYFSGIEGIWWLPAGTSTDYLIVSNPYRKPVTGSLALTSASGLSKQVKLALGPLQTARIDIREALGNSTGGDMGGVTLTFPGNEGISASEIVFDEVTGLAAIMKLFERDKDESIATHVLRAPMIALRQPDAALAYPKDTVLSPRLFLRNAGITSLQVSLGIDWRSPNSTGTYKYPAFNLSSNQLRAVDLGVLQDSGAIPKDANWGNVTLSYTGTSADLVPVAVSYDSKQRYGLQSPFTEGTNRMFKGGMWHVDSTHNSLITTGNGGSETTKAQVSLFYNGGKSQYRLEKVLAPGQQLLLDVGQLIRNQLPDSDGNVIPPETIMGSYELRDLDHPAVGLLYESKLTIDKTYGHASYGCGTCCGYYNPKLNPNPFNGPPSIYNQDSYVAQEQCGGYWDDFTGSAYSWQSTNTAVATLPNSVLYTVAVGSASGNAQNVLQDTHPAPRCPTRAMQGNQPVTVVPNITGPNTVWWFNLNGQSPNGSLWPAQITLTTQGSGTITWNAVANANAISLSPNGSSVTVTATGSYKSHALGDVTITVTVNGITSNPFGLTVMSPSYLENPNNYNYPCSGDNEQGWDYYKSYRLRDNFNNLINQGAGINQGVGVNESFSGQTVWPKAPATGYPASDGTFTDEIFVCATPGALNPMPLDWGNGNTLVDSFTQTWCAGASTCDVWGAPCYGAQVQSGTIKRYLDHGVVTIP